MTKGTILIIEDDQEFRKIYGDRLLHDGFIVIEASDGLEGLTAAREKKVDLIVTDIHMPNMDGLELIKQLKEDETLKHIPVLVMSIFDTADYLNKARELGADGYIVKGTETPKEVAEKVAELVLPK